MRTIIVLYLLIFISCHSDENISISNENKYQLQKTNFNKENDKVSELYYEKNDTSNKLLKLFLPNNRLLSITYFTKHEKNGPILAFDSTGHMYFSGFYLQDKKNGLWCYYSQNNIAYKFIIYDNDKEMGHFDSLEELSK